MPAVEGSRSTRLWSASSASPSSTSTARSGPSPAPAATGSGLVDVERALEHGQPMEQALDRRRQEVVAPANRRLQGPLPRRRVTRRRTRQWQPVDEAIADRGQRQQRDSARRRARCRAAGRPRGGRSRRRSPSSGPGSHPGRTARARSTNSRRAASPSPSASVTGSGSATDAQRCDRDTPARP